MTSSGLFNYATLLVAAVGLACQSPADPADTDGATDGDGTTGGATDDTPTGGETDGGPEGAPILERTPVLSHTCEATAPLVQLGDAGWHTDALAVHAGAAWQVRSDESALALSTVAADGTLGASVELDGEDWAYREPDLAVSGDRLAVVWLHLAQSGAANLRFAVYAPDGAPVVAPRDIGAASGYYLHSPRVLPRAAGGWSVFYADADDAGASSLRHLAVDADGAEVGAAVEVVAGGQTYGYFAPSVVTTPGGYALLYTDDRGAGFEVFVRSLAADAAPSGPERRLSRAAGGGWYANGGFSAAGGRALLARGDRLWATWTESYFNDDFADPEGETTVHVGVVDDQGAGATYQLAAAVAGKRDLDPTLFALGDTVGLMWTTGTIIFVCGGCIADDDVKLVLIDPTAVAPASEVVTHAHLTNGLVRPKTAVLGPQIVHTADVDFHALTKPAVGMTTCAPL